MHLIFYKQYAHKALNSPSRPSAGCKYTNKVKSSCSMAENLIRKFCNMEVCVHTLLVPFLWKTLTDSIYLLLAWCWGRNVVCFSDLALVWDNPQIPESRLLITLRAPVPPWMCFFWVHLALEQFCLVFDYFPSDAVCSFQCPVGTVFVVLIFTQWDLILKGRVEEGTKRIACLSHQNHYSLFLGLWH